MRSRILWRTQNLMLTDHGVWWAMWRMSPMPFNGADMREKERIRRVHEQLARAIRGEALLLGLTAQLDPSAVVERMMHGVRMDQCPEYLEEVELSLDSLSSMQIGTRSFWLAVPLRVTSLYAKAQTVITSGLGRAQEAVGMRRRSPTQLELRSALDASHSILEALPDALRIAPATPAEMLWIHDHSQVRGLNLDTIVPTRTLNDDESDPEAGVIRSGADLSFPLLDEGGQSDVKQWNRAGAFRRRYLKVQRDDVEEASYQSMLAVTGTPAGGWIFPGVEWIPWVDHFPFDVDWAVRLHIVDGHASRETNRKSESALEDQETQQSGDASITGGATSLATNRDQLAEFHGKMQADEREVEVQATTIFTVAAPTPGEVTMLANALRKQFKDRGFTLDSVFGEQESLWWAMQPGIPTSRVVRHLAQLMTGRDFSSIVPLITYEVGDHYGVRIGVNRSTARQSPVFINPYGATQSNMSGSCGFVGDLGSGKSYTMKLLAGSIVDRGGRLVAIDHSARLEYAKFAKSLRPKDTIILDVLRPEYSLDPMRVFGPEIGPTITQALFSAMFQVGMFDPIGQLLSDLLETAYTIANGITSMSKLYEHVNGIDSDEARSLARVMRTIRNKPDLSAVIFDDDLPPVPLDARAIVFCTQGLNLPKDDELNNESRFAKLPPEKIFGGAIYSLLAAIGRAICFATDEEFAVFLVDEAHHMTMHTTGREVVEEFVTDGRKNAAALLIGTQTCAQLGSDHIRGLIPYRFVMRLVDEELAKDAATWLVGSKTSPALVQQIMDQSPIDPNDPDRQVPVDRRGEGILRDGLSRIAPIKVLLPERESRRESLLTTPPTLEEAA